MQTNGGSASGYNTDTDYEPGSYKPLIRGSLRSPDYNDESPAYNNESLDFDTYTKYT